MDIRIIVSVIVALLMTHPAQAADDELPGRWPAEKANAWYKNQPWLCGANYITSSAVNQLEMFQPDTFDLKKIDREMGFAESIGMNTMRVFLHNLLWKQDGAGFLKRLDQFVDTADKHQVKIMFVLFDSCWDPYPQLGKQRAPKPHVHNSGWVQSPGIDILRDPAKQDTLEPYVKGVIGHFAHDKRVVIWDLFNEQDNPNGDAYGKDSPHPVDLPESEKALHGLELMKKVYKWAREVNPDQPLTTCVWWHDWADDGNLNAIDSFDLHNSDVVSYHCYGKLPAMQHAVDSLRRFNRPLICTEYMARPEGSTFADILPYLKQQNIAAYNWGFVDGKSQTKFPWDSWKRDRAGNPYGDDPPVWFHDIFHPDGTPYRAEEITVIKRETGRA